MKIDDYEPAWIMHLNLAVSCFNCESSRRNFMFSCSRIAALKDEKRVVGMTLVQRDVLEPDGDLILFDTARIAAALCRFIILSSPFPVRIVPDAIAGFVQHLLGGVDVILEDGIVHDSMAFLRRL